MILLNITMEYCGVVGGSNDYRLQKLQDIFSLWDYTAW